MVNRRLSGKARTIAMVVGGLIAAIPGYVSATLRGDANGDGRVTPGDAQLTFDKFINPVSPGSFYAEAADIDPDDGDGCVGPGDGNDTISPADAQRIFNKFLDIATDCPPGWYTYREADLFDGVIGPYDFESRADLRRGDYAWTEADGVKTARGAAGTEDKIAVPYIDGRVRATADFIMPNLEVGDRCGIHMGDFAEDQTDEDNVAVLAYQRSSTNHRIRFVNKPFTFNEIIPIEPGDNNWISLRLTTDESHNVTASYCMGSEVIAPPLEERVYIPLSNSHLLSSTFRAGVGCRYQSEGREYDMTRLLVERYNE